MAETEKPVMLFTARQILADMSADERPAFKIEADEGPVLVVSYIRRVGAKGPGSRRE